MATATRLEPQSMLEDGEELTYDNAYEVIDGVPVGRPTDDPAAKAYEEAYEIVDGQYLEWPIMGALPEEIASILFIYLGAFIRQAGLGRPIVEGRFQITPERLRRPDMAFLSFERWPKSRRAASVKVWDVCPDLAVEVISQSDETWEVIAKVKEYFDAGVRAVWVIYPNVEVVHVYHAWDRIEVVTKTGTLDGGDVVPGFRLPLAELFEGEDEPVATTAEPAPEPTA